MATLQNQQALQEMMSASWQPLQRLTEGRLALAMQNAAEQRRRQEMEMDFANRVELVRMQNDALAQRSKTENEAALGRAIKLQQMDDLAALERALLQADLNQSAEAERIKAQGAERERMQKEADKRILVAKANDFGVSGAEQMNEEQLRKAIQKRAGEGFKTAIASMATLEAQLRADSGVDPVERRRLMNLNLAQDPKLQAVLGEYPQLLQAMVDNTITPQSVLTELQKEQWGKSGNPKSRAAAFMGALPAANLAVIETEAANPDARKRPDYLQRLTLYRTLNEQAKRYADTVTNPEDLMAAMQGLKPANPTHTGRFVPAGQQSINSLNRLRAALPPARTQEPAPAPGAELTAGRSVEFLYPGKEAVDKAAGTVRVVGGALLGIPSTFKRAIRGGTVIVPSGFGVSEGRYLPLPADDQMQRRNAGYQYYQGFLPPDEAARATAELMIRPR